jgi:AraC-like DNA-binding protein
MDRGSVDLTVDNKSWQMNGQWFWSCYPGPRIQFHPATTAGTWSHRYVAFRGSLIERWQRDGLFPVQPRAVPASGMDFSAVFDRLLHYATRSDRRSTLRATHQLEGLLLELSEPATPISRAGDLLEQVAHTISESVDNDAIYFDDLAASFGISPSTLRRRFLQRFGISPVAYFIQCRIDRARQMLIDTDWPLKQIAEELGYRDVFFFSRQFRRVCGVPPGTYRRTRVG